jgi:hypothetical protein
MPVTMVETWAGRWQAAARFYGGILMSVTGDGTRSHIAPVMVESRRARLGL